MQEVMNKLKRWIVHRLGGKFPDEYYNSLPEAIREEISMRMFQDLLLASKKYQDRLAFEIFKSGFYTSYEKEDIQ